MQTTLKRLAFATAATLALGACTQPESPQGVASVNGTPITQDVLTVYAAGRLRKPAVDISDEERDGLLSELQDIYLLADVARRENLDREPNVIAQMSLQRRSLLAQAAVANFREQNPVTDDELLAEYDRLSSGAAAKQYKARHILVESKTEAIALIGQLDAGADFAELAKASSTGPSGPNGGDLGWFAPDSMVKPFADAVIDLPDGAYSKEPVQTQFGWHVILREGARDNVPPPFDEVKEQIRPAVEQQKLQEYLEGQRALAGIG